MCEKIKKLRQYLKDCGITQEAASIAQRWMAANGTLDFGYRFSDYTDFRSMVGRTLRNLRDTLHLPTLCYYSARKTFVQFGYELGIPLYILEYAVGQTVKDERQRPIYQYFKIMQREADNAVRKIIDHALQG